MPVQILFLYVMWTPNLVILLLLCMLHAGYINRVHTLRVEGFTEFRSLGCGY